MKKILGFILLWALSFFSCEKRAQLSLWPAASEIGITADIKRKILEFKKVPARVEVRNYLKNANHKYQENVKLIKKIKTPLDPLSEVYLELNLFTNESDKTAPLVVQFMWFDVKTKKLIREENINLNE
ncbi:MAG: hypothetical protein H7Z71_08815 [Moraxellaceae bacterium]|nr:hypothetical protein [Pseudobdellovibrionaceae bacterium]